MPKYAINQLFDVCCWKTIEAQFADEKGEQHLLLGVPLDEIEHDEFYNKFLYCYNLPGVVSESLSEKGFIDFLHKQFKKYRFVSPFDEGELTTITEQIDKENYIRVFFEFHEKNVLSISEREAIFGMISIFSLAYINNTNVLIEG